MSARRFETTCTVTHAGDEKDCAVRAYVAVEPGLGMGGGWGAACDGTPEIRIGRSWVDVDVAELGEGDVARIVELLETMALEDDGGHADEGDYDCERDVA